MFHGWQASPHLICDAASPETRQVYFSPAPTPSPGEIEYRPDCDPPLESYLARTWDKRVALFFRS